MNNDVEAGRTAAVGGSWNSIENCAFHFFPCYSILGSISGEAKKIRRILDFCGIPPLLKAVVAGTDLKIALLTFAMLFNLGSIC